MDFIKTELNQLMGKDRNKPLFIRIAKRDHFDDPDVITNLTLDLQIQPTRLLSQRFISQY
jgi:hypothetical protein